MQCIIILASHQGSGRLRENENAAPKRRSSTVLSKRIRADIDLASCRGRTRRRPHDPVEKLAESGREQESNYHLASTDPSCSMLRHSDADYM